MAARTIPVRVFGNEAAMATAETLLGAAIVEHSSDGVYVSVLCREGERRVEAAPGDNNELQVELTIVWDAESLFRTNRNIEVSG